jgi:hypothetical protein
MLMVNIKSTTIFSRIPFISSEESGKNIENKKISYWLKKLYGQREKLRHDNTKRDDQSKEDTTTLPLPDQSSNIKSQDLAQSGINEYKKNVATKNEEDRQIVDDLVKKSNRHIISISSSFPWNLFPNTIDVEEGRVTFKFRQFLTYQSYSVEIKDISNVFIESSFLFATLQVVSRTFIQNNIKIGNLEKFKAKKVHRIIEGLRTFAEHDINTSNYEIDELISKIEEFQTNHVT